VSDIPNSAAEGEHPQIFQIYTNAVDLIDDRNWWLSRDKRYAIWYIDNSGWQIGLVENVGSQTRIAYMNDDFEFVGDSEENWKYYDGAADEFLDANDGLAVDPYPHIHDDDDDDDEHMQ
jgi:hypothetical protein